MAPTKQNVMAGIPKGTGAIFRAPLGTPLPTDSTADLDAEYVEMGYVSNEGWARTISRAYNSIPAWGGDEVKKSRTEHSVGFNFTLIENTRRAIHEAKYGKGAVSGTGSSITVTYDGEDTEPGVWVIDMLDGNLRQRVIFPYAQDTTESFTQEFSHENVIGLPFEMTAFRDNKAQCYFIDYIDGGTTTMGV